MSWNILGNKIYHPVFIDLDVPQDVLADRYAQNFDRLMSFKISVTFQWPFRNYCIEIKEVSHLKRRLSFSCANKVIEPSASAKVPKLIFSYSGPDFYDQGPKGESLFQLMGVSFFNLVVCLMTHFQVTVNSRLQCFIPP